MQEQMKNAVAETVRERERMAESCFAAAREARMERERKWELFEDYYRCRNGGGELCVTDAYIHVESQIEPEVPDFHFAARDDGMAADEVTRREYAVKYVAEANRLDCRNTANERRLLKYGDAFWKVRWDQSLPYPGTADGGDIRVEDVDPRQIYPDPSAGEIQEGEYLIHTYPMTRRKARRAFAADLKRLGAVGEKLLLEEDPVPGLALCGGNGCVTVTEFYFRTAEDRVALSVLIGGREIRFVPDFWLRTGEQNRSFPFVQYWRIRDERNIWNISELEFILPLIDAADRELMTAEKNRAFMANDMLIVEEDALADGVELTNEPGAVVTMRPGRFDRIRRLNGMSSAAEGTAMAEHYTALIERTVGNFDSAMGEEPERVVTASGIELLNARADARREIKRADRLRGFAKLYELIDWFCLEFYDDGRMIRIGREGSVGRRGKLAEAMHFCYDDGRGERVWFPRVECMMGTEPGKETERVDESV
ncbi:MAG: hypothetical protein IJC53_05200 [Clostridia bacterium]|nr:hypothetical protein [Clostridia bacterium]